MLPPKQLMTEPPPPSAYVDQFMADLMLLPEASVAKLAEGIPEDEVILPLEKIRTHITANPARIPRAEHGVRPYLWIAEPKFA